MTNTAYNFRHTKLSFFNNCQPFNASLIHVVSKISGHTSRQSFVNQNEKRSHKAYFRQWVASEFKRKITVNNKHLNYAIFYSQVTLYIYLTRCQFNNCWVFIVYESRNHNKCWKWPALASVHERTRPLQSFQGAGTFESGLTGIKKCVGEVPVRCQMELNAVRVLSLFTVKNLKNCGQKILGLYLENEVLADIHWYESFPLFGIRVLTAEVLPSISDTPCIFSMYACVCIRTYDVRRYVYVCTYLCIYVCMYVRTYVCMHAYIYVYSCVCVCT